MEKSHLPSLRASPTVVPLQRFSSRGNDKPNIPEPSFATAGSPLNFNLLLRPLHGEPNFADIISAFFVLQISLRLSVAKSA